MTSETEKFIATKELEQATREFAEAQEQIIQVVTRALDVSLKSGAKLIECSSKVANILKTWTA